MMFVTLAFRDFLGAWVHLGIVFLCGMECIRVAVSHHLLVQYFAQPTFYSPLWCRIVGPRPCTTAPTDLFGHCLRSLTAAIAISMGRHSNLSSVNIIRPFYYKTEIYEISS